MRQWLHIFRLCQPPIFTFFLFYFNKVLVCIAACCGVPETAGGQNAWNSLFLLSVDTDPFFLLLLFLFPLFLHRNENRQQFLSRSNESIQDMLRSIENRNRLCISVRHDYLRLKVLSLEKKKKIKEKLRHFNDSTTDSGTNKLGINFWHGWGGRKHREWGPAFYPSKKHKHVGNIRV